MKISLNDIKGLAPSPTQKQSSFLDVLKQHFENTPATAMEAINDINRVGSDVGTGLGEIVGNAQHLSNELMERPDSPKTAAMMRGQNLVAAAEELPQNVLDKTVSDITPYLLTSAVPGGAIADTAANTGMGALLNPNDRLSGALTMGGLTGALHAAPMLAKNLGNKLLNLDRISKARSGLEAAKNAAAETADKIQTLKTHPSNPEAAEKAYGDVANDIYENLMGGDDFSNPEVKLGNEINANYNRVNAKAKKNYEDAFTTAARNGNTHAPLSSLKDIEGDFKELPSDEKEELPSVFKKGKFFITADADGVHLERLHAIQSELGRMAARRQNIFLGGIKEANRAKNIRKLQKSVRDVMLHNLGEEGSNKYKAATNYFKNNIVPYQKVSKILEKSKPMNFTGIGRKFANVDVPALQEGGSLIDHPVEEDGLVERPKIEKTDIGTLLAHGGRSLRKKILGANFKSALAREDGSLFADPDKLRQQYRNSEARGLGPYIDEGVDNLFGKLKQNKLNLDDAKARAIALDRLTGQTSNRAEDIQKAVDRLDAEKEKRLGRLIKLGLIAPAALFGIEKGKEYL